MSKRFFNGDNTVRLVWTCEVQSCCISSIIVLLYEFGDLQVQADDGDGDVYIFVEWGDGWDIFVG